MISGSGTQPQPTQTTQGHPQGPRHPSVRLGWVGWLTALHFVVQSVVAAIGIGLLMAPVRATGANPGRAGAGDTPQRTPGGDGTPEVGTRAVIRAHVPHNRSQSQLPAGADARGPPHMKAKETPDDHTKLHGPPNTVFAPGTPLGSRAKGKGHLHVRRSVRVCCRRTRVHMGAKTQVRGR